MFSNKPHTYRFIRLCASYFITSTAATSNMASARKRVAVIGSGSWGSTLARLVGSNVKRFDSKYDPIVNMWVFEEEVHGRRLSNIINEQHENVKYLPGIQLPDNVVACIDLEATVRDADAVLLVLPHQFIRTTCQSLIGKLKESVVFCSAVKGFYSCDKTELKLITQVIRETLKCEVGVLMGANIAGEVAKERFCETTLGFRNRDHGLLFKELVQTPNFRAVVVNEVERVEACGALKNVVAFGAGLIDGLYDSDKSNTKAAIIRLGFMEMLQFCEKFFPEATQSGHEVFFESCGVADLITTCYAGRNRQVGEEYARNPERKIADYEKELLGGQLLQGPMTAREVNALLGANDLTHRFPIFTTVYNICYQDAAPATIVDCCRVHPVHED